MQEPKPINLMPDAYWRSLGWAVLGKDSDGHVITVCAVNDAEFRRDCARDKLTITKLK